MGLDMSLVKVGTECGEIARIEWRKFNALHNWFVQLTMLNNCETKEVSIDELKQLHVLLEKSLITHKPLLKPISGFFFGSTEVNEYYWQCVLTTYCDLTDLIKDTDLGKLEASDIEIKYFYSANW